MNNTRYSLAEFLHSAILSLKSLESYFKILSTAPSPISYILSVAFPATLAAAPAIHIPDHLTHFSRSHYMLQIFLLLLGHTVLLSSYYF